MQDNSLVQAAGISSGACFNVGIGYSSLSHVTTGDKNVVLGCRAGMLLTTANSVFFKGAVFVILLVIPMYFRLQIRRM